jgi:hypothetical protein
MKGKTMVRCHSLKPQGCTVALATASLLALISCGTTGKPPLTPGNTSTTTTPTAAPNTTGSQPATTTSYAIPGCYPSHPQSPTFDRPARVLLDDCKNAALWLQDLSWTSWGRQGADGTGTVAVNTCIPDCTTTAAINKTPVIVHASNAQPASPNSHCPNNVSFYRDLIFAFPETVPPSADLATDTQYEGMPAVHNPPDVRTFCE